MFQPWLELLTGTGPARHQRGASRQHDLELEAARQAEASTLAAALPRLRYSVTEDTADRREALNDALRTVVTLFGRLEERGP